MGNRQLAVDILKSPFKVIAIVKMVSPVMVTIKQTFVFYLFMRNIAPRFYEEDDFSEAGLPVYYLNIIRFGIVF